MRARTGPPVPLVAGSWLHGPTPICTERQWDSAARIRRSQPLGLHAALLHTADVVNSNCPDAAVHAEKNPHTPSAATVSLNSAHIGMVFTPAASI